MGAKKPVCDGAWSYSINADANKLDPSPKQAYSSCQCHRALARPSAENHAIGIRVFHPVERAEVMTKQLNFGAVSSPVANRMEFQVHDRINQLTHCYFWMAAHRQSK